MKKKEAKLKLPVKKSLTLTLLILSIFEAACIIIQAASNIDNINSVNVRLFLTGSFNFASFFFID